VLETLKSLFNSPQRDAKRLNRDAPAIIDSATKSFPVDRVREIALMTLENLGEARTHLEEHTRSRDQILYRFKQLHGEARRRMDQVGLTAYTLVIIDLRAAALGDMAKCPTGHRRVRRPMGPCGPGAAVALIQIFSFLSPLLR
jgi:hypothetical protein